MKTNDYLTISEGAKMLNMSYHAFYYYLPKLKIKNENGKTYVEKKSLEVLKYVRMFMKK